MGNQKQSTVRPAKRLYSLSEASQYLGRSEAALRALINNGTLPTVRIDRKVQFDIHDLDEVITNNKRQWTD